MLENMIRYSIERWQGIRRTGKNYVIGMTAGFNKLKHVHLQHLHAFQIVLLYRLFYKSRTLRKNFNRSNILATPGRKFIRYATGSTKQIKHPDTFKIEVVIQHVEQAFFCKVGGGAGWYVLGRFKA